MAPRRIDGLFSRIASFPALEAAARRAAAGKRRKPGVAAFLARLEPELIRIERELLADSWRPGRYIELPVRDPRPCRAFRIPSECSLSGRSPFRSRSGRLASRR